MALSPAQILWIKLAFALLLGAILVATAAALNGGTLHTLGLISR